jgi:endonuclease YncB( thermonuclease family)
MKFLLLLPLFFALAGHVATIEGRVVGITDGDTVTVLDANKVQHRIRLAGIDAPEKRQDFGYRSKESLSELVYDRIVFVQTEKKDRYGRDVGKVLVQGVDVSLVQVQRGLAWHYKAYEREQLAHDRILYDFAESQARAGRRGLWVAPDPVPPWDFRRKKRNK